MRLVKCTDADGDTIVFRGKAKAARHITMASGNNISEYKVQLAADSVKDIPGFQLSWATDEDVQQHACDFAEEASEGDGGEDDMQQDGAMSILNAPTR